MQKSINSATLLIKSKNLAKSACTCQKALVMAMLVDAEKQEISKFRRGI